MFEKVPIAPPDPILGLTEAFLRDPNPDKINLGAGVYVDESGRTPLMESVKRAEARIVATGAGKSYLPIEGSEPFRGHVLSLVLGSGGSADGGSPAGARAAAAQSVGGTGALRIAADFVNRQNPAARAWVTDPSWPNHPKIFAAAGFEVRTFPWLDEGGGRMNASGVFEALEGAAPGDVVVLHGSCHNPTGVDPSPGEWRRLAETVTGRGILPIVDLAYQGVGDGLEEDAGGVRSLCENAREVFVAVSFSKNFSLYRERVGALLAIAEDAKTAGTVLGQVKSTIRASYSSPPAHGAALAAEVLGDAGLRSLWEKEVEAIRNRVRASREALFERLASRGIRRDLSFIRNQRGMFAYFGLDAARVDRLRTDHSVYAVSGGRLNVAGITPGNLDRLCDALADVLGT